MAKKTFNGAAILEHVNKLATHGELLSAEEIELLEKVQKGDAPAEDHWSS